MTTTLRKTLVNTCIKFSLSRTNAIVWYLLRFPLHKYDGTREKPLLFTNTDDKDHIDHVTKSKINICTLNLRTLSRIHIFENGKL